MDVPSNNEKFVINIIVIIFTSESKINAKSSLSIMVIKSKTKKGDEDLLSRMYYNICIRIVVILIYQRREWGV